MSHDWNTVDSAPESVSRANSTTDLGRAEGAHSEAGLVSDHQPIPAERLNVTIRHTTPGVAAGNVASPSVRCRRFAVQCRRV
jgi:hypothetical protein